MLYSFLAQAEAVFCCEGTAQPVWSAFFCLLCTGSVGLARFLPSAIREEPTFAQPVGVLRGLSNIAADSLEAHRQCTYVKKTAWIRVIVPRAVIQERRKAARKEQAACCRLQQGASCSARMALRVNLPLQMCRNIGCRRLCSQAHGGFQVGGLRMAQVQEDGHRRGLYRDPQPT